MINCILIDFETVSFLVQGLSLSLVVPELCVDQACLPQRDPVLPVSAVPVLILCRHHSADKEALSNVDECVSVRVCAHGVGSQAGLPETHIPVLGKQHTAITC